MKHLGLAALLLVGAGCQSFGAFSQPDTLPAGALRLGVSGNYDNFHASDERISAPDLSLRLDLGLTDQTELGFGLSVSTVEVRLKHALLDPASTFALTVEGGAGFFTAYSEGTTNFNAPLALVGGLRPTQDVMVFLGPQAWGAVAVDTPGRGAGFNRGTFGLLGGGVGGVALESKTFIFCPQVTVLTPLATGARGTVVQVSFGVGTRTR